MGSKWQRAGGKAGGTQVGRQQEKHSSKLGVPTRELVAQALGCELGSLGWSRARYGASQSGRQQGCGQGRRRWTVGGISISTTVPWGVRCAVLQRPRTATVRHGYSTSARGSGVRLVTQRAAAGQKASDNDGEREERHGAAEAEGGCGNERFGGQRRGALSKSDINHGRRALGGLDLDPDSTATTAGLS